MSSRAMPTPVRVGVGIAASVLPPVPGADPDDVPEPADADVPPWPGSSIEVYETDNPVTGVLYAADGSVLVELHERPMIPFGYHP